MVARWGFGDRRGSSSAAADVHDSPRDLLVRTRLQYLRDDQSRGARGGACRRGTELRELWKRKPASAGRRRDHSKCSTSVQRGLRSGAGIPPLSTSPLLDPKRDLYNYN